MTQFIDSGELKSYMNERPTTTQTELVRAAVNKLIERYCNRDFSLDSADRTETYRVLEDYQRTIVVRKPPIVSLTKIESGETTLTTVDSTSYEIVDAEAGLLRMINTFFLPNVKYTITYKGGYSTLPDDIKLVALSIAAREIEHAAKGRFGMRSRAGQGSSADFFIESLTITEKLLLDSFRIERLD